MKSNSKGRGKSARKADQPFITYKNKQRQRARHARRHPNDKASLERAVRWVRTPEGKKGK